MSPFVHLHVHSCYSLLRGGSGLHTLLARVKALDMPAIALTDTNAMYGLVPFYTACRGMGLHPVLGVEIRAAVNGAGGQAESRTEFRPKAGEARGPGGPKIVALARNLEGYANLCRLTTARHLEPAFELARTCVRYQDGVYFLTEDSALLTTLAAQVPGWRLFAELVPRPGRVQRARLARLRTTAGALGVGCVVANDVFFATPDDYATHRTLRAIDCIVAQAQLDPDEHEVAPPEAWLTSGAEMEAAAPGLAEAMAHAGRIAEDCRVELPLGTPRFPEAPEFYSRPARHPGSAPAAQPPPTSRRPTPLPDATPAAQPAPGSRRPARHPGSAPAAQPPPPTPYARLRAACERGLRRRYGPRPAVPVRQRLDYELEVIDRLGFSAYFLIVHDIVRFAQHADIPCVGRGSAADSLVAYVLGIGGVDPIRYDLYFERFLHLGRTDCPDIDIDFCWRGRDTVLDYVYETYGADRVAMICSYVTFGARSAFRDVAKTFGLPLDEIERLASHLPHADVANIRAALERFPECRDLPFDMEPYRSILALAERIDGFPRHLGIHPCGIVIAPSPLTDLVPLERATKGLVVTQYDMHPIEALGLVKIDLLGQRALSIVTDAARTVRERYGHPIDLDTLPEPDPNVADLARRGDTLGCFQIDSPGMRNLLQQIRAETRLDLIKALSLIRPGPAASGMKEAYVRRARGLEPTPALHPMLDALLADTHGVLLYQEDLLRIAHKLAGFSRADADALRKAMSKRRSPARMAAVRERFLAGCAANGVAPALAQDVWTRMSNFAGYSYCKAHACTYGHISYQGLWLKAYYPTAFAAAVLNNAAGMYSARTYLEDARRHGIVVRPVDIQHSAYWTTVELAGGCTTDAKAGNGGWMAPSAGSGVGGVPEADAGATKAGGWPAGPERGAGRGGSQAGGWPAGPERGAGGGGSQAGGWPAGPEPDAGRGGSQGGGWPAGPERGAGWGGSQGGGWPAGPEPDAGRGGSKEPPAALRLGLWHVEGLSKRVIDAIIVQRPFRDLRDLCYRVPLERDQVEALVRCGACDRFGLTRPQLLWEVAQAFAAIQRSKHAEQPLFPGQLFVGHLPPVPPLPEYDAARKLEMEQEVLGLELSMHPLEPFSAILADADLVPAQALPTHGGKRVRIAGWLVASRRVITKTNDYMRFVTLEDATGLAEVVLFPDTYQAYGHLIRGHGPYIVTGLVDDAYGACTLTAEALTVLDAPD